MKTTSLPGIPWPESGPFAIDLPESPPPIWEPVPTPPPQQDHPAILGRREWARGGPVPSLMNRMTPVRYITIHHDGMAPFMAASKGASADRIELIRRAHRGKHWGDIGYHYVVDRAGRVWEGRAVAFQGAHVKDYNEGNIGVVALGNFDYQYPSEIQLASLQKHVGDLARRYGVPLDRIRTHQEWSITACPGRNLQASVMRLRASGQLI